MDRTSLQAWEDSLLKCIYEGRGFCECSPKVSRRTSSHLGFGRYACKDPVCDNHWEEVNREYLEKLNEYYSLVWGPSST